MTTRNEWTFIGNLGKDAEVKQLENGQLLVFSVAIDRGYFDKNKKEQVDKTQWAECSQMFPKDKKIELVKYLRKGIKVQVDGIPYPRAYRTSEGEVRANLNVSVKAIQPLTWPENKQTQSAGNDSGAGEDDGEKLPF